MRSGEPEQQANGGTRMFLFEDMKTETPPSCVLYFATDSVVNHTNGGLAIQFH
jgi:hypothetical protein